VGELAKDSVVAKFATTAEDGKTYQVGMVLAVQTVVILSMIKRSTYGS